MSAAECWSLVCDGSVPADRCKVLPLITANVLHHSLHSTLRRERERERRRGREGESTPLRSGEVQIIGTNERDGEEVVESKTVGIDFNTHSSLDIDISFS